MFLPFFDSLRRHGVPVALHEFLSFLNGVEAGLGDFSAEGLYHLARVTMVKDERHLDRFDRVFAAHFAGAEQLFALLAKQLPEDWLRALGERLLSEEEKRIFREIYDLPAYHAVLPAVGEARRGSDETTQQRQHQPRHDC